MGRVFLFVRSVLPGDLAQIWLLGGALCLYITPNLRWAPWGFHLQQRPDLALRTIVAAGVVAIYFSGCLGYLVCLRPGRHPVRRLLCWVCLPAAFGLISMCGFYVHAAVSSPSAWQNHAVSPDSLQTLLLVLQDLGPAFHYSLIGFALVVGFTVRMTLGSASLPLALPKPSVAPPDSQHRWHRVAVFVWLLVVLLPAVQWTFPFLNLSFIYHFVRAHVPVLGAAAAVSAQLFVTEAIIVLIAVWIIRGEAWRALRRCLRWPSAENLALGAAFPVGIAVLLTTGHLLFSLLHPTAHGSASGALPSVSSYFKLPGAGMLWLLPFALCEEIIFRGILQPLFVRRYGILRGVFLVGIFFGAEHFSQDFSIGYTDGLVIAKLGVRLFSALALSFVAGWLTLKAESVLPAALAHGLMNVLGTSPLGPAFPWIGPVIDLLWAGLAYALFRYWPIHGEADRSPDRTAGRRVPAPLLDG